MSSTDFDTSSQLQNDSTSASADSKLGVDSLVDPLVDPLADSWADSVQFQHSDAAFGDESVQFSSGKEE